MSLKFPKLSRSQHPSAGPPQQTLHHQKNGHIYGRPLKSCLRPENEVGDAHPLELTEEGAFLSNLRLRFASGQIYTAIESTVIAINPYERLSELYGRDVMVAYEHHSSRHLPPHIFGLCKYVLYCLKERSKDQCILISGVSGSGKTESFKIALNYFIHGSSEKRELNLIKRRLSQVPVLLQAFGNASTDSNENSSRLFYMLEIDVDFGGDPLGGQIVDYFLEKTRVARYEIFGLNYHVLYQLVGGAPTNLLKYLKLQRNIDRYYLLKGKRTISTNNTNAQFIEDFGRLKSSLQVIGFTSSEIIETFQVLAFVLKLGQLQFLRRANIDSTEGCHILHDYEIVDICEAFGLEAATFRRMLTQKVVRANENDVLIAELCAGTALKIKNCLCKTLYFRLMTWLIDRINQLIRTHASVTLTRSNLTLFDSIGFEEYDINFFEQLLANYLYEKEQQVFIDVIFNQRQAEADREEIQWQHLDLATNDLIVDLIERPVGGILTTLNEDTNKAVFFREEIFIEDLKKNCQANLHFTEVTNPVYMDAEGNGYFPGERFRRLSAGDVSKSLPQLCFAIKHYQATVVYSVNGFIEKNSDHIGREWTAFFYKTEHCLLRTLFPEGNPVLRKSTKKTITLAEQFTIAIENLIAKLQAKEIHFIKCLRPNRLKIPNMFDDEFVYHQLSSQFLLEANYIACQGYFYSESYRPFFRRFRILSPETWPTWKGTDRNGVVSLIKTTANDISMFTFGKTKVFVKHQRTLLEMEERRREKRADVVVAIQKNVRSWLARTRFRLMVRSQILIASYFRKWKRRRYLLWLRHHLPSRSPLSREWPPAPKYAREASSHLRRLYHKWRCHRYRLCFDQTNRNRMREKVTAMTLFKGRKVSYRPSVAHPFRGDYIRLRKNAKWKRMAASLREVYVVFADLVYKITKRCGKFVQKLLVISTSSLMILDHRTMEVNHHIKLNQIYRICASPYNDNILILNIYTDQRHTSKAFLFESSHLLELITKLFLVVQNGVGRGPPVEICHEFQVKTGNETLVIVFKSARPSLGTAHNPRQPAVPSSRPASVRIHRKAHTLEITVS